MTLKEQARTHLLACNGNGSWYDYSLKDSKKLINYKQAACYANFRGHEPSNFEFLGVGYYTLKVNEAGMSFFKWITGKKSPWRSLLVDPVEIVEDDLYIRGFFVGPETLAKAHKQYLMNFLIASRNYNEFKEHIDFWWKCVQEGIPEERAYIYSKNFGLYDGQIRQAVVNNTNHWPLCGKVNTGKFRKSLPSTGGACTNGIWSDGDLGLYGTDDDTGSRYSGYVAKGYLTTDKLKELDKEFGAKHVIG